MDEPLFSCTVVQLKFMFLNDSRCVSLVEKNVFSTVFSLLILSITQVLPIVLSNNSLY